MTAQQSTRRPDLDALLNGTVKVSMWVYGEMDQVLYNSLVEGTLYFDSVSQKYAVVAQSSARFPAGVVGRVSGNDIHITINQYHYGEDNADQ